MGYTDVDAIQAVTVQRGIRETAFFEAERESFSSFGREAVATAHVPWNIRRGLKKASPGYTL